VSLPVRARRRRGVRIDQVGALMAADDPAIWRMMRGEGLVLHVVVRLPRPLVAAGG
jgi:hypothetical protein